MKIGQLDLVATKKIMKEYQRYYDGETWDGKYDLDQAKHRRQEDGKNLELNKKITLEEPQLNEIIENYNGNWHEWPKDNEKKIKYNNMENTIWGIDKKKYNQMASSHSKANIFLWLIAGIVYNIYQSNLISISTLLVIIPGIFIISFASIPTFWVEVKKRQIVPATKNIFVLILFTIWSLVDLIYPVLLSIGYILLVEYILKFF